MMTMTVRRLLEMLEPLREAAGDAPVRVNGEYVEALTTMLRSPIAKVTDNASEVPRLERDKTQSQVVDIDVNGHESEPLPIREYDFRTW